jgi:hypothetical protein
MSYYKILFIVNAIVVFAFGVLLLVAPTVGLAQFKMDARVTEVFLARVVGAALMSLGLVLFFGREVDETAQKFLGIAALAGSVLALIVTLTGVLRHVIRANGWIAIILELLFALAYAFVVFLQPRLMLQQQEE